MLLQWNVCSWPTALCCCLSSLPRNGHAEAVATSSELMACLPDDLENKAAILRVTYAPAIKVQQVFQKKKKVSILKGRN